MNIVLHERKKFIVNDMRAICQTESSRAPSKVVNGAECIRRPVCVYICASY